MSLLTSGDGTELFYKDWGQGRPIVFSHAWPLNADAWDSHLVWFASRGMRAVAHDRRGHGRSGQGWSSHSMDTYADDLAAVLERLNLRDAVLVGHSAGGGEVVRYLARHGEGRVSAVVLIGAPVPSLVETSTNPGGVARSVFDGLRDEILRDRAELFRELAQVFFGADREGNTVSQGLLQAFWLWAMQAGTKAVLDGVSAFSETDFGPDLALIHLPTLVVHADDDRIVPISVSALRAVRVLRNATLRIYPGASHGLPLTHPGQLNQDLLEFINQ
jgi:non-heme chloroperoxidase